MTLYWQERKAGEHLILAMDDESKTEVGAVRRTPRGFDALAMTNTYDPGRAQKGFATIEEAKAFVESFHPWDLFGGDMDMEVEPEVRRLPNEASTEEADDTPVPAEDGSSETVASVEAPDGTEDQAEESDDTPVPSEEVSAESAASVEAPDRTEAQDPEVQAAELPRKRGWQFWKKG